jgi:hypothetical protein
MFKRSVPPVSLFIAALMPTKAGNQEPRHRLVSQANIAANLDSGDFSQSGGFAMGYPASAARSSANEVEHFVESRESILPRG